MQALVRAALAIRLGPLWSAEYVVTLIRLLQEPLRIAMTVHQGTLIQEFATNTKQ